MSEFGEYDVKYAFVHVNEQHPYMAFDTSQDGVKDFETGRVKGQYAPARGSYLELGNRDVLLSLTGPHEVKRPEDGTPRPLLLEFAQRFVVHGHAVSCRTGVCVRLPFVAYVSPCVVACDDSVPQPDCEFARQTFASGPMES